MSASYCSTAAHHAGSADAGAPGGGAAPEESGSTSLDPDIYRVRSLSQISLLPYDDDDDDDEHVDEATVVVEEKDGNEEDDEAGQFDEEDDPEDDIEASFIQHSRPPCSKTRLISCLSSGSTSPGPLSPLLSDDDFGYDPSSESGSSRRSSSGAHTPRVRFKRGCVITQVNLTWAPASYDRAPINVTESLDIKRCHSFDCAGEDVDAEGDAWMQDNDRQQIGEQRPPSPPLASSPCTAAHTAYAYASTFGPTSANAMASPPADCWGSFVHSSAVPCLVIDESSGSETEEAAWAARCTSLTAAAEQLSASSSIASFTPDTSPDLQSPPLQFERFDMPKCMDVDGESGDATPKLMYRDEPEPASMPARKTAKYGRCGMGKFNTDDLYDSCDALGGF